MNVKALAFRTVANKGCRFPRIGLGLTLAFAMALAGCGEHATLPDAATTGASPTMSAMS
jgi:hypothetical protein